MTHRQGSVLIIEVEKPQQCDLCGKIAELRPCGPNYECICFECGEANEPTTTERMHEMLEIEQPPPTECPVCGYFAFNGYECFDCGYRTH